MKISGKVVDENGQAVASANIVKFGNKSISTRTDSNGNFVIENDAISSFDNFIITYVGYKDTWKKASELQNAKVILPNSVEELEEVVIPNKPKTETASILPKNVLLTNKRTIMYGVIGLVLIGGGIVLIKKFMV